MGEMLTLINEVHEMTDGEKMKLVETLFLIHEAFGVDGVTTFEIGHERELDGKHVMDDWGITYRRSPHGLPVAKAHPLKDTADLEGYTAPQPDRGHLLLLDLARERFVNPYNRRLVERAHALGLKVVRHSDGNLWAILDELIASGYDGLNPLEPQAGMNLKKVKDYCGDKICLLVSVVYWSILIFTLPVSVLIDRWSRKKSIGLMALLWGMATLAFNNLAFAANTFVTTALMTWLPSYFQRAEDLSMSRAATKGGIVMLLAIIGAPLGGWLTDRWMKHRKNARLLFPAITSVSTALFLLVAFGWFTGPVQYALLLCAGVSAVAFVPGAVAVTQDVVHPGLRAVSLSLCVIIQHVLGSALGPPVIGALSDRFGLGIAMTCLPLFALAAGGLFWMGSFFYVVDNQRVEAVARSLSAAP